MRTTLHTLRLLALILWLGGLIFFGAVLAPLAFHTLPTQHLAAIMVGGSLRILHWIGMACAGVLIATSLLIDRTRRANPIYGITFAMLLLTAYSQFSIIPRMDADRDAAGDIAPTCTSAPCADFNRLHPLSVHVEEAVMVGGLALAVMLARQES